MKSLLLILAGLAFISNSAFAQTNCPGSTYLGWGQGAIYGAWTNFSASFPNSSGYATCSGPLNPDADGLAGYLQTCTPTTWDCQGPYYGNVSYNDGTISYSGPARFWFDLANASTPTCTPDKDYVPRVWMVRRLKIQSCTTTHTLTNRFLAVSCDGSYCESLMGLSCTNAGGYYHENWIDLQISGF